MAPIKTLERAPIRRSERIRKKVFEAKLKDSLVNFLTTTIHLLEFIRVYLYTNVPTIMANHYLQLQLYLVAIRPLDIVLCNVIQFYKQVLKQLQPKICPDVPATRLDHEYNLTIVLKKLKELQSDIEPLEIMLENYVEVIDRYDCSVLFRNSLIEKPDLKKRRYDNYRKSQPEKSLKYITIMFPVIKNYIDILLQISKPIGSETRALITNDKETFVPKMFDHLCPENECKTKINDKINIDLGFDWQNIYSENINNYTLTLGDIANSYSTCDVCLETVLNQNMVWSSMCSHYSCIHCTDDIFKHSLKHSDYILCHLCRAIKPIQSLSVMQRRGDAWIFSSVGIINLYGPSKSGMWLMIQSYDY